MLWKFFCVRVTTNGVAAQTEYYGLGAGRTHMKLINGIIYLQIAIIQKLKLEEPNVGCG